MKFLFPPLGIYWLYPVAIVNLLYQILFLVGFLPKYNAVAVGWILSVVYIVAVISEILWSKER
jgi:uncharacterized membrane protein YphA (DoxX/SURF4 family)